MPLPQKIHYLIECFDTLAVNRGGNRRLPAMLLKRDAAGEPTARDIVVEYEKRLYTKEGSEKVRRVPHALLTDDCLGPRDAVPGEPAREVAAPHVHVLDELTKELAKLPPGAGKIRLSRFNTCRAVLNANVNTVTPDAGVRQLRDHLYEELLQRRGGLEMLAGLAGDDAATAIATAWASVVRFFGLRLPRSIYGLWLKRRRTLRWVGSHRPEGANFLRMALEISVSGESHNKPDVVQRLLLTALINDLAKAVRPSRFWVYRARRRWSFVLLLPDIGAEGTTIRQLLDTYEQIARDEPTGPLMVLGAAPDEPLSYAQPVAADADDADALARQVRVLYARPSASAVYLVPLSPRDDDGPARSWLQTKPRVDAPPSGQGAYVRAVAAPVLALALVATGIYYWRAEFGLPPSCHKVSTGEIVGVTDGSGCHLGSPGRDDELLDLEAVAKRQNDAAAHSGRPYRTVVFFAPLTAEPGDSTPVSLQSLRGALAAQHQINSREGAVVQIRLLLANSGKYFAYGSRNPHGPDVAAEIIERKDRDKIAAVIGITQSRPASFAAVAEISAASIPVIGNSVSGSKMVDERASSYYFQVSPSNDRIAQVMAEFSAYSEEVGELTTAKEGARTAVVVYDPDDEFFSSDLQEKFSKHYKGGKVVTVPYYENRTGQIVSDVARDICTEVGKSDGFILYAGRSGEMPALFDALQAASECRRKDGRKIAVLSESTAAKYLQDPADMMRRHSLLQPYYMMYNNSNGKETPNTPYSEFTAHFRSVFTDGSLPEGNAAGAYDALQVASAAINAAYVQYRTGTNGSAPFQATDVYARLSNPGIENLSGATGLLTLNSRNRFPPNGAVYILQPHLDKSVTTLVACGNLPDQPVNSDLGRTWGPAGRTRACP
ncbi:ABC transporter substrate-binding protein [Streptomyces sp. NPDC004050]